ncbi:MAG: TMEM198/TM7SF3 family protein [Coprococcus sp.]|nr:TMEM198/TM7SF3 family protein [Coprococcus sp.]
MEIMDILIKYLTEGMDGPTAVFITGNLAAVIRGAVIASAVLSFLMCLFGLKLIRVWNVLYGLLLGGTAGGIAGRLLGQDIKIALIIAGVCALLLGILGGIFKKFGAFWVCFLSIFTVAAGVINLNPQDWIWLAVCGVLGLLAAVAAMIWLEPLVIISTAFIGGFGAGNGVILLLGLNNLYVSWAIYAVLVIAGMALQFMMKSREIGRKQAAYSSEVKGEISMEAEIEQARTLFGLDDDEEEEE